MPGSPAVRYSPGRESDNHKRGRSLESGIVFKERDDDDLALFNEVQTREKDDFLLQSNDDFEDTFVTKLRHFSDHKLGINIASRGESSDLLNGEDEKNDYEWLITPPDTPLFASLDDEPKITLAQRGRTRTQPISISRSSTMEKSHRSSRGSPSPNRLSPSPRSSNPALQPRGRASSAPTSSPPPAPLRPTATAPRRLSPPSRKPSSPAPRASTPTSRSQTTGISPAKTSSRGNSASPKVRAWQANIPGFSTEAPPNLRTSLADRPASYVRGSSPASRNGRHSRSPSASRSIGSSHSHHSKGSIASSGDEEIESLPSVAVDGGSERSYSRKVGSYRNNNNNKLVISQKTNRVVSSSSAPKRSFDLALRQMDHKRGPQNMFRPLLSSVPSSTIYVGKPNPTWNSSVTTSSNASSDFGTCGAHDHEENDLNQDDDATSGFIKLPDCNLQDDNDDDQVFMFEKNESLNEDIEHQIHESKHEVDGFEKLPEASVVPDGFQEFEGFEDMLICSRCGCRYSDDIRPIDEEIIKLCEDCKKSYSLMNISDSVMNEAESIVLEEDQIVKPAEVVSKIESDEDLVKNGSDVTHSDAILNILPETPLSEPQSEERVDLEAISQPIEFANSKVDSPEPIPVDFQVKSQPIDFLKRSSSSIKGPVFRSGNFSASSYDDLSYVRGSTNSMRSSVGSGSLSASSSVDFGPGLKKSSSKKSEIENFKYQRSISSLSGISSPAFRPSSSVGTSTFDSLDASIVRGEKDVFAPDAATVGAEENPGENHLCIEIEKVNIGQTGEDHVSTEDEKVNISQTGEEDHVSTEDEKVNIGQTGIDLGEIVVPESLNLEDPAMFTEVEGLGEDSGDVTGPVEVKLSDIPEGEVGQTCLTSSSSSSRNASQRSERSVEEFQELTEVIHQDVTEVSATDCNTLNHSNSSIIEESTVMVESGGGTKGRSLTLDEATDTILFCSSIVQNLAYSAANIAVEKETQNPDTSFPLIPSSTKNEVQVKKSTNTNKHSSKSQKSRHRKPTKSAPDTVVEETDLPKPRYEIIYGNGNNNNNNKENTRPPKLESKCNCRIM